MPRSSCCATSGRSQTDDAYPRSEYASSIALASGRIAVTRMTSASRCSVLPSILGMLRSLFQRVRPANRGHVGVETGDVALQALGHLGAALEDLLPMALDGLGPPANLLEVED